MNAQTKYNENIHETSIECITNSKHKLIRIFDPRGGLTALWLRRNVPFTMDHAIHVAGMLPVHRRVVRSFATLCAAFKCGQREQHTCPTNSHMVQRIMGEENDMFMKLVLDSFCYWASPAINSNKHEQKITNIA